MKFLIKNSVIILLTLLSACAKPEIDNSSLEVTDVESINIPDGFDFSTYRKVDIKIHDNSVNSKYDVYAYTESAHSVGYETFENQSGEMVTEEVFKNDILNKLIFSGVPKNGILEHSVNIPNFYEQLYIRKKENLKYSGSVELITDNKVEYFNNVDSNNNTGRDNVEDYLYCVNGSAEHFQVNPLDGSLTYLSDMPMGSYTAAIDQENGFMYSIGRSSPHPLMKYDIASNSWEIIANLGIGGPRLDFNVNDRLLYFSKLDKLYTFDPVDGTNLNIWDINGLHNTHGGDLAFAADGTLFLCSFSGLYRLDLNENNEYDSVRISADNLPFYPTSMTFDSNQDLWLANNASSSDLIIMDTVTGGWEYVYGINANNGTDFGRTINDLTTFRIFSNEPDETDTDGDGVVDNDDAYPNDPDVAYEIFTPSKYGTGSIVFEDLWPSSGDYDFNDMALNYKAIVLLNSDNLVVRVDFICRVKSNSAGFTNGIGIEIEGLASSDIESVSGTSYSENYINLNANGTESAQDNAVIIFTDNADNLITERTITINFVNPTSTTILGEAPFKPFLIANKVREHEIHLPFNSTTQLGQNLVETSGMHVDPDGNYISDTGYPWALSIIHDFKVPKESVRIYDAYNFFSDWATSGGNNYKDWYKDNPGYRNSSLLKD
ncbi:LruC domain-containing protein [Winogradskyella poriferorum]|uniref:LruC domain-containing protein n=1 Tax=Winogradskyella poriferorum TaxID=307627 RepID=UPI003D65EBF3